VAYVYYYSSNLSLQWESGSICRYFYSQHKLYKISDLITPVDEWAEIAFSGRQNAKNEYCESHKN